MRGSVTEPKAFRPLAASMAQPDAGKTPASGNLLLGFILIKETKINEVNILPQ